jgi:prepilin-type N-terminal cleavage/methylation domain-containing protein
MPRQAGIVVGARRDRGFTLLELLVGVVVLGILITIAIPAYLNYTKGAENKAGEADVRHANYGARGVLRRRRLSHWGHGKGRHCRPAR